MERDSRYSGADEWLLREFFFARRDTIGAAIAHVEPAANPAALRRILREAASERALSMPAGEVAPSGYPGAWGRIRARGTDPNYGHSVSEHGPQIEADRLMNRATNPGRAEDVGQWYDNSLIIEAERRANVGTIVRRTSNGKTIHEFDMGRPVGRVFRPNGTVASDVTRVCVVRYSDGRVETSFPIQ